MWQPNRAQWLLIWPIVLAIVMCWPPADGPSLGIEALHWLADPAESLPRMPDELPMGLGDDGDAVARHDAQMAEYFRVMESSAWIRARLRMKDMSDPFAPTTARQLLTAIAIFGALGVWRLGNRT